MKKEVFLFDPTCLPYRINVYNYFIEEFKKYGIKLTIYYDIKKNNVSNANYIPIKYNFKSFWRLYKNAKPDVAIYFIQLSYKWSLPFLIVSKLVFGTKNIVWSKGINITNKNQPIKNILYYIRQYISDALIIYSENELKYIITDINKVFIVNNTINQYAYELNEGSSTKDKKNKYGIKHDKIVLFVGRIEERKRPDILINSFKNNIENHALVIVGPGLSESEIENINSYSNIYYLGPIYDIEELSKIYNMSDIFCIPGHIGLGVNEAFLFGLPVVTADINNDPKLESSEPLMLIEDGYNGLYFDYGKGDDVEELSMCLLKILDSDEQLNRMSVNAKSTFYKRAKIEYMRDRFINAIKYVTS